jgi:hypothetical protein
VRKLLLEGKVRTITAFRLCDTDLGAAVLREAQKWLDESPRYGFKLLLGLAAQCINRSYHQDEHLGRIQRAFLSSAAQVLCDHLVASHPSDRELSVTCSEFVYSCYIAADVDSIKIRDPLSLLTGHEAPENLVDGNGGTWNPPYAPDDLPRRGDSEPDHELAFTNRNGPPTAPSGRATRLRLAATVPHEEHDFDTILTKERGVLYEEFQTSRDRGKQHYRASDRPTPYGQTVTPFDLWQSSSLTAVKVLHLPPVEGDPEHDRLRLRLAFDGAKATR